VLLSAAAPSRLMTAFPLGVAVRRLPLAEALARVREQLAGLSPADGFGHGDRVVTGDLAE
jgi:ATP-dependent DNA helicase DinG